jgi:hypothetical protein
MEDDHHRAAMTGDERLAALTDQQLIDELMPLARARSQADRERLRLHNGLVGDELRRRGYRVDGDQLFRWYRPRRRAR